MIRWKHKILLGIVGAFLVGGLAYQNCGHVDSDQAAPTDAPSAATTQLKPKEGKPVVLTLTDGTKLQVKYVP
jgi:hypothetical protein